MYKIFDRRTCGLSHQIKGPTIVKLANIGSCRKIASFTIVGPLIWYDNPQVRLSKILYINNNDFHQLGRSQLCAGAWYVLAPQMISYYKCIDICNGIHANDWPYLQLFRWCKMCFQSPSQHRSLQAAVHAAKVAAERRTCYDIYRERKQQVLCRVDTRGLKVLIFH